MAHLGSGKQGESVMSSLWVIMPTYNEEACIEKVLSDWLGVLRDMDLNFTYCILNDGSQDNSLALLRQIEAREPEVIVVDKPNSGSAQTCLIGYDMALSHGADWVLQIDSDGQCDAEAFRKFWQARTQYPVMYGYRWPREDGMHRYLISRVVSCVVLAQFGVWVPDAGVPYRLMRRDVLAETIRDIPKGVYLANILMAIFQQKQYRIHWIQVAFKKRIGGMPKISGLTFVRRGWEMIQQFQENKRQLALEQQPTQQDPPGTLILHPACQPVVAETIDHRYQSSGH